MLAATSASAFTITSGIEEGQSTNATSITIEYFDPTATYNTCTLDGNPIPCSLTSATIDNIAEGAHNFTVGGGLILVIPPSGSMNITLPSDEVNFTVDRTDPVVSITSGPAEGATITTRDANFGISTNEGTLACRADGAAAACDAGGLKLTGLRNGIHELVVEATDAAGNTGRAARIFAVQPVYKIKSAPKSVKRGKAIKLKLNCSEACTLKAVAKLGKKKLKLKSVKAKSGNSTVKIKLTRSQAKSIKSALKSGKSVKIIASFAGGNSKTVKIRG